MSEPTPSSNTLSVETRKWIQPLTKGFVDTIFLLFFVFIVPYLIVLFFEIGLSGSSLIAAISLIPLSFIATFIRELEFRIKFGIYIVSIYATGFLAFFSGLLILIGIDDKNLASISILCLLFFTAFLSAYLHINLKSHEELTPNEKENQSQMRLFVIFGILIVGHIIGIVYLITESFAWVFFAFGILQFLTPRLIMNINLNEKQQQEKEIKAVVLAHRLNLLGLILILTLNLTIFSYSIYTTGAITFGWAIFGVFLGLIMWKSSKTKVKQLSLYIGIISLFILYLIFVLASEWAQTLYYSFISGVIFGVLIGDLVNKLEIFPSNKKIAFEGWFFFILALFIGASFLGTELRWLARGEDVSPWMGFVPIAIFAVIALITKQLAQKKTEGHVISSPPATLWTASKKITKISTVLTLFLIVLCPLFIGGLYQTSSKDVFIKFDRTMYLVDGTPVDNITLSSKTAVILLYKPNPTGPAHSETIRLGKSIRLGAYFYGFDGISVNDTVNWIGNNMDVYSFGFCGDPIKPSHIQSILNINNASKFYYMAFATSLFEDANGYDNGTWGNTHYPTVKFNETMYSWTLKLKNGSEALAVRRDSPTSSAHCMDLGKDGWTDYFAWIYTQRAKEYHAAGVAIDEVMWKGYWGTDVEDLKDYTSMDQINKTCDHWLEHLRSKTDMEIITQAYWDTAQVHQNGVWGECSFRSGNQYGDRVDDRQASVWYYDMNWSQIVDNAYNQGIQNRSYIWAAWYERGNKEALEYSIATYLMAKPNNCLSLVYHPQPVYQGGYPANLAGYSVKNVMEEVAMNAEYFNLEMGDALGTMCLKQTTNGKYWQRNFANGIVLVNPYHPYLSGFGN